MEKKTFKINNVQWSVIESREYNLISNHPKYNNYVQPQKEVLKTVLIPKIRTIISELISNNRDYECIQLESLKSKYTKADKSITLDFIYNDKRENIYVIAKIYESFKRELWNSLLEYRLYLA